MKSSLPSKQYQSLRPSALPSRLNRSTWAVLCAAAALLPLPTQAAVSLQVHRQYWWEQSGNSLPAQPTTIINFGNMRLTGGEGYTSGTFSHSGGSTLSLNNLQPSFMPGVSDLSGRHTYGTTTEANTAFPDSPGTVTFTAGGLDASFEVDGFPSVPTIALTNMTDLSSHDLSQDFTVTFSSALVGNGNFFVATSLGGGSSMPNFFSPLSVGASQVTIPGGTMEEGETYYLHLTSPPLVGTSHAATGTLPLQPGNNAEMFSYNLSYYQFDAIPEPSSLSIGVIGMLGLLIRRRR